MITRLVFALGLLGAASTAAAADQEVYLATLPGYPPYTFYEDGAEHVVEEVIPPGERSAAFTGYSWDIAREAFHAAGWTVRLRITPWARGMYELKQGKTHLLFPTGKNPERLEYMQYSDGAVVDVNFLVYTQAGADIDYDGLPSLRGRSIAVVRGFNYGAAFNQADHFEKEQVDSIKQGFELLRSGRVDGFAGYDIVWDYRLGQWGWADEFDKLAPFDQTREYVAGLQGNEAATRAIEAFDRGLQAIRDNGTLAEIREKWQ